MSAPLSISLRSDPAYAGLKEFIIQTTGLSYYLDKDADLIARLERRMLTANCSGADSYRTLLGDPTRGPFEVDALVAELTIGETFFFRHREMFDALQTVVLPERIEANRFGRQLRIWSAGCATGAEPFSVSILLRRHLAELVSGWELTILGTDINRQFLARARSARFDEWALRATPEDVRRACFALVDGSWSLHPSYREGVFFQYHNLVTDPAPSVVNNLMAFDVILCRNVSIYFSPDVVQRLVHRFHECLVPGGWLLVGHAEPNLETFRDFRTVNSPGAVLYRREHERAPVQAVLWQPPDLSALDSTSPASTFSPDPPSPSLPPAIAEEMATIRHLADTGKWAQAESLCNDLVARSPLVAGAHFYRGLVLEQRGDHAAAEQALRRAIYLDRRFVLAHYYLGLLAQKRGDYLQASRSFRNAIRLLSPVPDAHIYAEGEGITAGELRRLAEMSLATLEGV